MSRRKRWRLGAALAAVFMTGTVVCRDYWHVQDGIAYAAEDEILVEEFFPEEQGPTSEETEAHPRKRAAAAGEMGLVLEEITTVPGSFDIKTERRDSSDSRIAAAGGREQKAADEIMWEEEILAGSVQERRVQAGDVQEEILSGSVQEETPYGSVQESETTNGVVQEEILNGSAQENEITNGSAQESETTNGSAQESETMNGTVQEEILSGSAQESEIANEGVQEEILNGNTQQSETPDEGVQGETLNGSVQESETSDESVQGETLNGSIQESEMPEETLQEETVTGSAQESETPDGGVQEETAAGGVQESEMQEETVWEDETPDETEQTDTDAAEQEQMDKKEAVHFGIDTRHRYGRMKEAFSDGYQPEIEDGMLYLVVPFTASGPLKQDRMTVNLEFAEKENSPFVFKNYQKEVEKKQYEMKDGIMEERQSKDSHTKDSQARDSRSTDSQRKDSQGKDGRGPETGDLGEMETYLYQCEVPLLETAAPGQYSVTVKACGYTEQAEKVTLDCQIFVRIPEPPGEDAGGGKRASGTGSGGYSGGGGGGGGGEAAEELIRQPKMLLADCNLTGKSLKAGGRETLEVSFENRSEEQTMYNLKVTAGCESEAVRLGRNSYYFSRVAPGEKIQLEDELTIAPLAEDGTVPLYFDFEYEDKKGNAQTGKEAMTLLVTQPVNMELEMPEIPSSVYASDTLELSLKALNLSRTGVYNVRVQLSGTGMFPGEEAFIGNMEAGTEGTRTMRVYVGTRTMQEIGDDSGTGDAEKYGPVSGTVTLQYEDINGETHELTKEYQTEIKKAEVLSLKVEEEPEANSWWISVFGAVTAGLSLLILILIWRLRRKNVLLEEARQSLQ